MAAAGGRTSWCGGLCWRWWCQVVVVYGWKGPEGVRGGGQAGLWFRGPGRMVGAPSLRAVCEAAWCQPEQQGLPAVPAVHIMYLAFGELATRVSDKAPSSTAAEPVGSGTGPVPPLGSRQRWPVRVHERCYDRTARDEAADALSGSERLRSSWWREQRRDRQGITTQYRKMYP